MKTLIITLALALLAVPAGADYMKDNEGRLGGVTVENWEGQGTAFSSMWHYTPGAQHIGCIANPTTVGGGSVKVALEVCEARRVEDCGATGIKLNNNASRAAIANSDVLINWGIGAAGTDALLSFAATLVLPPAAIWRVTFEENATFTDMDMTLTCWWN